MRDIDDGSFATEVLGSDLPVLVDFWAPWCAPCRMVAPIVEKLARELEGALKVVKVNVDEAQETAQRYRVQSIPTLAVFAAGKLASQVQGALPEAQLVAFLEKAVPGLAPTSLTPVQLEKALKEGAVVLDLRPAADFTRNHVDGSVSAPADPEHPEAWTIPGDVAPDVMVVLVDKAGRIAAPLARRVMKTRKNVAVLAGGIFEWELSGRRLTSS